jgi:hypothetical protein
MSVFLIFVSFLLNIVAFLAIILLYTRQNRLMNIEKKQEKVINDLEDIISSYLLEMKEENEQFMKQLENRSKVENKDDWQKQPNSSKQDDSEPTQTTINTKAATYQMNRINANKAYSKMFPDTVDDNENNTLLPPIETEEENTDDSLEKRVLFMHHNGKTAEEIAKLLGKGKTEIELLLKFRQNK